MEDGTDRRLYSGTLSFSKCWQGQEPYLCFQATWTIRNDAGVERNKGFFVVDARRGHSPFKWLTEKPENLASLGSASALVRKFLPSSSVLNFVSQVPDAQQKGFAGLILKAHGSDQTDHDVFLLAVGGDKSQIELIAGSGQSLFRWSDQGCYTVRKRCEAHLSHALEEDVNPAAVQVLMTSLQLGAPAEKNQTTDIHNDSSVPLQAVLPVYQREARDRVSRRLKTIRKTLAQDEGKLPKSSELARLKIEAQALRSWIHIVKDGQHELALSPEMIGDLQRSEPLIIALDPDLSPGENLNRMFERIQKMERGLALGTKRVETLRAQMEKMAMSLDQLKGPVPLSQSETTSLLALCGLQAASLASATKDTQNRESSKKKKSLGRTFLSSDNALMILGRTAEENDVITKSAKSNDWWFHAASGVHGTHVIVPARSLVKGELTAHTIREAMILAIHFSSLALSKQGEVYITKRSALKKRKGAPAGLWHIERSETMMVRYTDLELTALFSREKRHGTIRPTTDTYS